MATSEDEDFSQIVELNVGGVFYTTTLGTLKKQENSLLAKMFTNHHEEALIKDSKGKYFIDRDGVLFRYILDFLRNMKLVLPEAFQERERLKSEAEFFGIRSLIDCLALQPRSPRPSLVDGLSTVHLNGLDITSTTTPLSPTLSSSSPSGGCIIVGYRGTFAFGRDGLADVKFRKISRILVSGRVSLCREIFGDTLNEGRDPDRAGGLADRYTGRFFLNHVFLEQAFDNLLEHGFKLASGAASGTNSTGELKPGMDSEENKWMHFNEYVFIR